MSELAVIVASGGTDAFIMVTESAKTAREAALVAAAEIKEVVGQIGRSMASDALRDVQALLTLGEKSRVEVKKPYIEAGRFIDTKHGEFESGLKEEKARLNRLIADFDNAERKKAEEAARKLREEAALAEQERIKKLQDARNAETESERKRLQQEALAAQEKAKAAQAAVVAAPPKPVGVSSRAVWKGKCVDPVALYTARPDLIDLVPSQSRINAAVAGGVRECAGLHIYEDSQISPR